MAEVGRDGLSGRDPGQAGPVGHRGQAQAPGHAACARVLAGSAGRHVLPDRPEIRGMVARVVHLVEVRTTAKDDGRACVSEDPRAGTRLPVRPRPAGASAEVSPARAARPPGAAPRAPAPATTSKPGLRGRPAAAHPADPEAEGFQKPLQGRVHRSSTWTLWSAWGRPRSNPDVLREAGLVHKRGLVKVLGAGS